MAGAGARLKSARRSGTCGGPRGRAVDPRLARRYRAKTPSWPGSDRPILLLGRNDMKSRSLLAQVLAVNLLLVAGTMLFATVALHQHIAGMTESRELLILGLAVIATMLADWILLRRRFMPLDQLIRAMEQLDPAAPATHSLRPHRLDSADVRRLDAAFQRMVGRLDGERRAAGRAVDPGPGARAATDRPGPPRRGQPGADGRLDPPAGVDRERTAGPAARARRDQAPVHPGDGGAAGARPAAPSCGARRPWPDPRAPQPGPGVLRPDRHARDVQLPRPDVVAHARAAAGRSTASRRRACRTSPSTRRRSKVDVELSFIGRTMLRISDDGRGFTASRDGGLGFRGCASARGWSAASCRSGRAPGPARGSS